MPDTQSLSTPGRHDGSDLPGSIRIELEVSDPELIAELSRYPDGAERDEYAATALRVGILSLKRAEGRIDANVVRNEGERLLSQLASSLETHQQDVAKKVDSSLSEYFDPRDGRFTERVNRLLSKEGDLATFMKQHIGVEDSVLQRSLSVHLGDNSPLMEMLSPTNTEGFLATLSKRVGELLDESLEEVVGEFSLDNEESALSRLVGRVETSQNSIVSEFSLDIETSALSRFRRELGQLLKEHQTEAEEFRSEVLEKLASMVSRREEAMRSTRHGGEFEEEVKAFCCNESSARGDIAEDTSKTTGLIKNSKVGDLVIKLGPDNLAAGARITIEAKESQSYSLAKALEELETARKNRSASVGVFVFSATTTARGMERLARYGSDIVVVWDKDDPSTDPYLSAALMIARAISVQRSAARTDQQLDLEPLEKAVRNIEKLSNGLDEIEISAKTIYNSGHKIQNRVRLMRDELVRQVGILDEHLEALAVDEEDSPK